MKKVSVREAYLLSSILRKVYSNVAKVLFDRELQSLGIADAAAQLFTVAVKNMRSMNELAIGDLIEPLPGNEALGGLGAECVYEVLLATNTKQVSERSASRFISREDGYETNRWNVHFTACARVLKDKETGALHLIESVQTDDGMVPKYHFLLHGRTDMTAPTDIEIDQEHWENLQQFIAKKNKDHP